MEKLIEIKNLRKSFPQGGGGLLNPVKNYVHALNGVSLEVYKGEILGVVGESGCGKSTLGRCVLNLIEPTSGEVIFHGIDSDKELRRKAQLIFQSPYSSLNPKMRIKETLKEPLLVNGIKDTEAAIEEIISLVGLDKEDLKRYPHEFSGGQRQRIAIARSLILKPEFVVADEPLSALDVSIQAQIINLLIELKEKMSLTYLFISHDLSVVRYLCDRVAVMYLGEIVELAPKDVLFENPKHPYSQALLSSAQSIDVTKSAKKIILDGDLPSVTNLPEGCTFHTRCIYASEACKLIRPEMKYSEDGSCARCIRVNAD